jgi:hypothetical protein
MYGITDDFHDRATRKLALIFEHLLYDDLCLMPPPMATDMPIQPRTYYRSITLFPYNMLRNFTSPPDLRPDISGE